MVVRKMKEKCKDAARMRREKERAEFVELSKLLPLPSSITSQLDKASIIRLTSSYLRMRAAFPQGLGMNWGKNNRALLTSTSGHSHKNTLAQNQPDFHQVRELGSLLLQTLDGFVFALHRDGKIMYISETASVHLGLPQIDLTGSSVFEFIHPADHNDIYEILGLHESDRLLLNSSDTQQAQVNQREIPRSFCMRMKCILPKRNAGLVTSGYKAIHCSGYLKVRYGKQDDTKIAEDKESGQEGLDWESCALVAVGHSLLPSASTEIKLTSNSFMFRANLDLKLYYIEAPVIKLLGFQQIEMIGLNLYQFVHAADLTSIDSSHRSLLEKGQVVTRYYRLMKKDGGFVWVQSYASLVNNPRNMPKPQHIVCINLVLADNTEDHSAILHNQQLSSTVEEVNCLNFNETTVAVSTNVESKLNNAEKKILPLSQCQVERLELQHKPFISRAREKHLVSTKKGRKIKSFEVLPSQSTNQESQLNTYSNNHYSNPNQYLCACLNAESSSSNTNQQDISTIGSIRRLSEDSCSVVSSVASTVATSSVSSLSLHHSNEFTSYNPGTDYYMSGEQVNQPQTSPFIQPINQSSSIECADSIINEPAHHGGLSYMHNYHQYTSSGPCESSLTRNNLQSWSEINNNQLCEEATTLVIDSSSTQIQLNQFTNDCNQTCPESTVYYEASPESQMQSNFLNQNVLHEEEKSQILTSALNHQYPDIRSISSTRNEAFTYYNENQTYLIHYHSVPIKSGYEMSSI